jgi:2-amino-4-hydroxy-6-hydroxymethyldihydropteridine diphosphokinase
VTRVVLSIGSNLGDRLSRLQSVMGALGERVCAVSPVYETDPWGGIEQGPFLNAVILAEDPALGAHDWLRLAQHLERSADRVRGQKWGPRTLDVDLIRVQDVGADGERTEVFSHGDGLTLPHPLTHLRAFVLVPWLAMEPGAEFPVGESLQPVSRLLGDLDPADRAAVRRTDLVLRA